MSFLTSPTPSRAFSPPPSLAFSPGPYREMITGLCPITSPAATRAFITSPRTTRATYNAQQGDNLCYRLVRILSDQISKL